jgi:hypothetical protein
VTEGAPGAAALWLDALERLAERAAHEVRNPLNGALLNTEVVRSRTAGEGSAGAALAPFARAAAEELARVSALTEALLALARPPRAPVDLGAVLAPLVVIAAAGARARGGNVVMETPAAAPLPPGLDPRGARGALAATLDAVVARGGTVRCAIHRADGGGMTVRIAGEGGEGAGGLADPARAAIRDAGIGLLDEPAGYMLEFPAG